MIPRFVRLNVFLIRHYEINLFLQATVTNPNRNDSTIEQDYTENFDLALTNDNLYQDGNGPVESSVCICYNHIISTSI